MRKPFTHWLILKGQLSENEKDLELNQRSVPYPFKPLAFGWESTGRALAGLYIGDEKCHSQLGDGDAMFGHSGNMVKVPPKAQVIYPARRDFRLAAQDLSGSTNNVCLAILGLLYVGMKTPRYKAGPELRWVNLYDSVAGNASAVLAEDIDFPFEPIAIGYESTDRAEGVLKADDAPFMNVAGDLAAMFGNEGRMVPIPPEGRKVYAGTTTFAFDVNDLSGQTNKITVSILGVQYKT